MHWLQDFGLHDSMEISIHKLKHEVNVNVVPCLDDVYQLDHIIMVGEFLHRLNDYKVS